MAQEQLDLLKLSTGGSAHFRAATPQVMGGDSGNTRSSRVWLEELPHYFLGHSLALDLVRTIYGPQHVAFCHAGCQRPGIDGYLHPGRHPNGAHGAVVSG